MQNSVDFRASLMSLLGSLVISLFDTLPAVELRAQLASSLLCGDPVRAGVPLGV